MSLLTGWDFMIAFIKYQNRYKPINQNLHLISKNTSTNQPHSQSYKKRPKEEKNVPLTNPDDEK